ncbi:MAG TPA: hypothetical protein VFX89_00055 [Gammaproteobacteria bacterium]|nr:hypothetical protein [Gammaproteobacteria bacterium]
MSVEAGIDALRADLRSGRRIYVVTAALFLATAIVGFGPNAAAIYSGRYAVSPLVHVHGALMLSWLVLLLAQSALVSTGRAQLHRTLGRVSFALAPALAIVMIAASLASYHRQLAAGRPPVVLGNALLAEASLVLQFGVLVTWALLARGAAPETHKRMMLMATVPLLSAAAGRMPWLPFTAGASSEFDKVAVLYPLLLVAPAILHDAARSGRVHRAYLIGLVIVLAATVATNELWSSPAWHNLVRSALG